MTLQSNANESTPELDFANWAASNWSREPFVLYEVPIQSLRLTFGNGSSVDVSATLQNGRANYILFQYLVATLTGLDSNSEGGASDLVDEAGVGYEVKSYRDPDAWPRRQDDLFHTAASSTFGANNLGPRIGTMLKSGDFEAALTLCKETGFDKNGYYIYTNSSQYRIEVPFRYFIVPTSVVLELVSRKDPRKINRRDLLERIVRTEMVSQTSDSK